MFEGTVNNVTEGSLNIYIKTFKIHSDDIIRKHFRHLDLLIICQIDQMER